MSTRRRYSAETKLKVVKDASEIGNVVLVARRYSMVSKWVRQYKQYGEAAFKGNNKGNEQLVGYLDKDYRKLEDENERLKCQRRAFLNPNRRSETDPMASA